MAELVKPLVLPNSYFSGDFNLIQDSGIYAFDKFNATGAANTPPANYGIVISLHYGSMNAQLSLIAGSVPNVYSRTNYGDGWSNWCPLN